MRKKLFGFLILAAAMFALSITAYAGTYSSYWKQGADGNWHVYCNKGNMMKNCWVCDDAVAENGKDVWYLLDENGNMVTAGLVKDGTGNYYSLETNHNGYYGMLRYKSGTYDGITLDLESSHNGAFAAIKNADGIAALQAKYGLKDVSNINNDNCIYTSSFGCSSVIDSETDELEESEDLSEASASTEDKDYLRKNDEEYMKARYNVTVTDPDEFVRMCYELLDVWCYARDFPLPERSAELEEKARTIDPENCYDNVLGTYNTSSTTPYRSMKGLISGYKTGLYSYLSQSGAKVGIAQNGKYYKLYFGGYVGGRELCDL